MAKLSRKKKLLFALVSLVLFLIMCELGSRVVEICVPPYNVDYGLGFDEETRLFVPGQDDDLVTNEAKLVSFNEQAFSRVGEKDKLRIFMLGGSSVRRLKNAHPLKGQLEYALVKHAPEFHHVQTINCGGDSYGTHRLVKVLAEVLEYEPDVIMIYSGHNEFEEVLQLEWSGLNRLPIDRALSRSAFFRFVRDRWTDWQVDQLREEQRRRQLETFEPESVHERGSLPETWRRKTFSKQAMAERMEKYRENLTFMIAMCQNKNIPVVIGTVPSNLVSPELPRSDGEAYLQAQEFYKDGKFDEAVEIIRKTLRETTYRHQSCDVENEIIRDVAKNLGVPLADVEAMVIKAEPHGVPGETLFDDHCHLNEKGNEVLMETFAPVILDAVRK